MSLTGKAGNNCKHTGNLTIAGMSGRHFLWAGTHPSANSALANTPAAQGSRREVTLVRDLIGEHAGIGLFCVQTEYMITTGLKVMIDVKNRPHTWKFIIIFRQPHRDTPEFAATVVLIQQNRVPAVLVDIEAALAIDMALTVFQCGFYHVHTVKLPAGEVRIQMGDTEDFLVRKTFFPNSVIVVGDVDFPLAFVIPVIAIQGPVEDIGIICGPEVVSRCNRGVVPQVWRPTYPTLTGVVAPTIPGIDDLIQGLMNQNGATGKAGW